MKCLQVAHDALAVHNLTCLEPLRACVDSGCKWRKFHMTPPPPGPPKYWPKTPPTNTDLI